MRRRRRYDKIFKEEAVQHLISSGKTIKEVAENLGVERSCLALWRREYLKKLEPEAGEKMAVPTAAELDKENRRLRKELAVAIQQREILKKAVGIFSRDPERYSGS